jgi:hypothetical protein
MSDLERGLYVKYDVTKVSSGEVVEDCFVLRPDRDPAAIVAVREYARVTKNPKLAADILSWIGDFQPLTLEEVHALEKETGLDKRPFTWVWYQSLVVWDNPGMDYTSWKILQTPLHKKDTIAVLSPGVRYEESIADYGTRYVLYLHKPIRDPRTS